LKLSATTFDIHRKIVEESKAGNRLAQYQLYELYSKAMFNICYRMMNGREEAEDALQEAFITIFGRLDSFRFESTIGAWIKRIVVNHCINKLKKRNVELVFQEEIRDAEDTSDSGPDEGELEMNVQKVKTAMETLPDGYRVIFSLYLLEGYDHKEISEILNISESTSKTQYMRARKKVKEQLIAN